MEVCPEQCLKIVPLDAVESAPGLDEVVKDQLGCLPVSDASVIMKDETVCIRCALCADRCPTGALTMEEFHFEEKLKCQAG